MLTENKKAAVGGVLEKGYSENRRNLITLQTCRTINLVKKTPT